MYLILKSKTQNKVWLTPVSLSEPWALYPPRAVVTFLFLSTLSLFFITFIYLVVWGGGVCARVRTHALACTYYCTYVEVREQLEEVGPIQSPCTTWGSNWAPQAYWQASCSLWNKDFIWVYNSREIISHRGGESWQQAAGMAAGAGGFEFLSWTLRQKQREQRKISSL